MVKIDVRKLISFGKGSYIISVPKNWIEKNHLKKGDLISVNDDGLELNLSASQQEKKADSREITIDAKGKDLDLLKTEIVSSYLNDYDTISILFEHNYKDASKIKDIIRNLSGLEIMEQTSTRITAKNLIDTKEISIKNIIRRMDMITRAMMEDAILCYRGQCNYESIYHRDTDVNRLYFLGYRVIKNAMKNPRIAKSLGTEPWQLHSDTMMIIMLEKIADRQKRIARHLCSGDLDRAILTELDKIHTDISEAYNEVMKSYYNQDKQIAFKIEVGNKEKIAACTQLLGRCASMHTNHKNKSTSFDHVTLAQIIENLKATATSIKNISRTVLCNE